MVGTACLQIPNARSRYFHSLASDFVHRFDTCPKARYHPCIKFQGDKFLEPVELARTIVELIEDKKGEDILLLDTHEISSFSDFFVIATAQSDRQLRAITDDIQKTLKKHKLIPRSEGTPQSGWILIDYGSVIAHIFSSAMRDFYQLEDLWDKAPVVVKIR